MLKIFIQFREFAHYCMFFLVIRIHFPFMHRIHNTTLASHMQIQILLILFFCSFHRKIVDF